MRRGQIPLIIEDLDVYPQHPCPIGAPTLNSEEPDNRDYPEVLVIPSRCRDPAGRAVTRGYSSG